MPINVSVTYLAQRTHHPTPRPSANAASISHWAVSEAVVGEGGAAPPSLPKHNKGGGSISVRIGCNAAVRGGGRVRRAGMRATGGNACDGQTCVRQASMHA